MPLASSFFFCEIRVPLGNSCLHSCSEHSRQRCATCGGRGPPICVSSGFLKVRKHQVMAGPEMKSFIAMNTRFLRQFHSHSRFLGGLGDCFRPVGVARLASRVRRYRNSGSTAEFAASESRRLPSSGCFSMAHVSSGNFARIGDRISLKRLRARLAVYGFHLPCSLGQLSKPWSPFTF